MNTFAKRLGVILQRKGVSHKELVHHLNIDKSYVSKILSGDRPANYDTILDISHYLKINPSELFPIVVMPEDDQHVVRYRPLTLDKMVIMPQYASAHERVFFARIYATDNIRGISLSHYFSFCPKEVVRHYTLVKGNMTVYTPSGPVYMDAKGENIVKIPANPEFNYKADVQIGTYAVMVISGEYDYIYKVMSGLQTHGAPEKHRCSDCPDAIVCLMNPQFECERNRNRQELTMAVA